MKSSLANQLRTFWVLMQRDIRFILASLPGRLLNSAVIVAMQTLVIGQFLPLLGMPPDLIGPLFVGMITQIVFASAYGIAFGKVVDLKRNQYINYQLALPLHKMLLFCQYIIAFMIEVAFISLPMIILGSILLSSHFTITSSSWVATVAMYCLALLLYATIFIVLVYRYEYTWFIDNIWARRLTPLLFLGCGYYTWKKLYAFNKGLAILTLANPITYLHEGLRNVLLGGDEFIPLWICMGMTIFFCGALLLTLAYAIDKRLDPV